MFVKRLVERVENAVIGKVKMCKIKKGCFYFFSFLSIFLPIGELREPTLPKNKFAGHFSTKVSFEIEWWVWKKTGEYWDGMVNYEIKYRILRSN